MTPNPTTPRALSTGAWVIAVVLGAALFLLLTVVLTDDPTVSGAESTLVPIAASFAFSGYALLIGYIYGDAKRRGMRYVVWTILAALLPSAIGIILYFISRDPMPVHCTKCGSGMHPGYAFCPRCGASMAATCSQCHRVTEPGWSHCAWCGAKL